jgi:starch synthase
MGGPAIFFHADAVEGEGKELVGRRSAGQSFLRGFLQHVPGDRVHALTQDAQAGKAFEKVARELGEERTLSVHNLRGDSDFTQAGTVFFPGPGYLSAPWRRQRYGADKCSLVGITHTVSTRRVIEGLHHLMLDPVEDWDAIICTSHAVHSIVARQLEEEAAYIQGRFGATRVPLPQLPVIPLGIHAADFAPVDGARARMRAQFATPDDALVVMTMGRLTSVEKANPAPLFIALEQVAQALQRPVHLWMVGWANRDDEEALHRDGAAALAPSAKMQIIDGRGSDVRRNIWAGADVFTLPVDNIQETFGLVPVEAMAAGLPVVMPDWDGFRDTVVHGKTGFLIPTRMMGGGHPIGADLAQRFADGTDGYLQHLSLMQQQTQIDIPAYVAALVALGDAGLRAQMGQAGRDHVAATLDWSAVIPQYLALAEELAARRKGARVRPAINPLQVDPFTLYGRYPTEQPDGTWVVTLRQPGDASALAALDKLNGRDLYKRTLMPPARMAAFLQIVAESGPITIAKAANGAKMRLDLAIGAALYLAKYDYLSITRPQTN